jgi:CBS domain-containing protein
MELQDSIQQILTGKTGPVWTAEPYMTVYDALERMAEKEVGALPVLAGGVLVGMLSERDYARKVILRGRASRETLVADIMMTPPLTVPPEATVDACMRMMTEHRVRHLAVTEGGQLKNVISIGDLVNWMIHSQRQTIRHLSEYISGAYPG